MLYCSGTWSTLTNVKSCNSLFCPIAAIFGLTALTRQWDKTRQEVKQSIAQRGVVERRLGEGRELDIKGKVDLTSLIISSCGNLTFNPSMVHIRSGPWGL
jgi:hypothetical protein